MLKVKKYSIKGEETGEVKLPKSLFAAEANNPKALLYEVINMYLANQRHGTSSVKNRAEAHGSGRKLYRQKGTGNARAGNLRTPIRVGGGHAFGPKPKTWYKRIPKKKKRLALRIALTEKSKEKKVIVIEDLKFETADTSKAQDLLQKISDDHGKKLLLIDGNDHNIIKSFNNIPRVSMDKADSIYAYEILNTDSLILTESALKKMTEVFNNE